MKKSTKNIVSVPLSPRTLAMGLALIGLILQYFYPLNLFPQLSFYARMFTTLIGIVFICAAMYVFINAKKLFQQHHFTPRHGTEIKGLITNGIFARTRNPLYLSVIMILTGLMVIFNSLYFMLGTLIFWLYVQFYVIPKEEVKLLEMFGNDFQEYKKKTGQWITFGNTKI